MTGNGVEVGQAKKATIYLVRHGESVANETQMIIPPYENPLTPQGRYEAELLGNHLKDIVFTKAYASPYPRALETAKSVLKNSKMTDTEKPELVIDPRIIEREFGDFVGKSNKESNIFVSGELENGTLLRNVEFPGAETCKEFDSRIDAFLGDLFETLANKCEQPETILIVCHGLTILRLLSKFKFPDNGRKYELSGWSFEEAFAPLHNTAYHVFNVEVPATRSLANSQEVIGLEFLRFNQTDHLQPLLLELDAKAKDAKIEDPKQNETKNASGAVSRICKKMREDPTFAESQCLVQ